MLDILPILTVDFRKDITEDVLIKQCLLWWRTVDRIEWKDAKSATIFFKKEEDAAELGWLLSTQYGYRVIQEIEWHEEYRDAVEAAFKRQKEYEKWCAENYNITFAGISSDPEYEADDNDYSCANPMIRF